MSLDSDIAFALELLEEAGDVSVRRMFGGAGLYQEGVMFALLAYGAIWLRADPAFAAELVEMGSEGRFETESKGKIAHLPYWRLPESALDDPQEAAALARRAADLAIRLKAAAPKTPAKFRKPPQKPPRKPQGDPV